MTKIKWLWLVIGICVITNVFLLVRLFAGPHHRMPREIIIERLKFDDQQIAQYDFLIQDHRAKINLFDQEIRRLKSELYASVGAPDPLFRDTILDKIATLERDIQFTHLHHFDDIQKLCRENQLVYFIELKQDLNKLFSPPPPGKHHE